jgi:hypothetical protein
MAGTRTAPAFTAAATSRIVTLRLIDASGDKYAEAWSVPVAATAANIEAWAAAYAAASNASLYEIWDLVARAGDADPDNAVSAFRAATENGINLLFKNPTTGATEDTRLVAPIAAVMQGNQDIPLLSATELSALITAQLAVDTTKPFTNAQYTVRRERKNNARVG